MKKIPDVNHKGPGSSQSNWKELGQKKKQAKHRSWDRSRAYVSSGQTKEWQFHLGDGRQESHFTFVLGPTLKLQLVLQPYLSKSCHVVLPAGGGPPTSDFWAVLHPWYVIAQMPLEGSEFSKCSCQSTICCASWQTGIIISTLGILQNYCEC